MKKFLSVLAALTLSVSILAGCGNKTNQTEPSAVPESSQAAESASETVSAAPEASEQESSTAEAAETSAVTGEETAVRVMALKGPTAMGMVKLMDTAEAGPVNGNAYEFTIAASADEVTPKLVQGDADIAAVPANLASVLYNNTEGKIQVLAVNTLGVLYIVESGDTVQSAADLKGKTIYASGKGSTPEYALNYILSSNGIDPERMLPSNGNRSIPNVLPPSLPMKGESPCFPSLLLQPLSPKMTKYGLPLI